MHCRAVILAFAGLLSHLPVAATAVETIVLAADRIDRTSGERSNVISGTLVRELGRQALLIAAREELGWHTRDAALRERAAIEGETGLLMTVSARTDGQCEVRVTLTSGPSEEVLTTTYQYEPNSKGAYRTLAPQFEAASRLEMAEALRKLGLEAGAVKPVDAAADADGRYGDVDGLLAQADVISQFSAVQQTHALIAAHGESPAGLTRLVRGYAHLGLLTEPNWSRATNALKARSLIYAQRYVAKYPADEQGRLCRAYAYALAGIHFAALEDLAAVDAAATSGGGPAERRPEWGRLVAPFCNFELAALDALLVHDSLRPWASVLEIWNAYAGGEDREFTDRAIARLGNCSEAYSLVYLVGQEAPVGLKHMAEQASLSALARGIPGRLRHVSGMPVEIVAAATELTKDEAPLTRWPDMLQAISSAGDGREMDWPVLAALLEDVGVSLAATIVYVHQTAYQEHPLDEVAAMLAPVVQAHPSGGYFRLIVPLKTKDQKQTRDVAANLSFEDSSRWMYWAFYAMWYVTNDRNQSIGQVAYEQAERDFTCYSIKLATTTARRDPDFTKILVREMGKVSPQCPMALVYEIKNSPVDATVVSSDQLAKWKERAAGHPAPWAHLGALHVAREEYDDAIACYEKAFALSPDASSIHSMAEIYERQERFDLVAPTLERYLEVEDYGLGHSHIHAAIAEFLLRREDHAGAKRHGLEAAASYSARGLEIAARSCERAGDESLADHWYAELSRAYPSGSGLQWFLYRARSGIPAEDESRRLAEQSLGDRAKWDLDSSGWWPVLYTMMDGKSGEAFRLARRRVERSSDLFGECQVLVLAIENKDLEHQTAALARMRRMTGVRDKANQRWDARFVRAVDALLAAKTADQLPTTEMDALITDYNSTISWCDAAYVFGKLALLHDFPDVARVYFTAAHRAHDLDRITWHLAVKEMARLSEAEAESEGAEAGDVTEADDTSGAEQRVD